MVNIKKIKQKTEQIKSAMADKPTPYKAPYIPIAKRKPKRRNLTKKNTRRVQSKRHGVILFRRLAVDLYPKP